MKNKLLKRIITLTMLGLMLLPVLPIGVSASTISFTENFEKALNNDFWYAEVPTETSITTSTKYAQSGTHSLRVELNKTDEIVNDSKRAEIAIDKENPVSEKTSGQEHTYTFYTMLPNGGSEDYKLDPEGSEIIAQWHNTPDDNEEWTCPPLSLHTYNGNYVIGRCWDDAAITTDEQMTKKGNCEQYTLGSYIGDKGKWVQWKFHIKWGWSSEQKPILEIYKNGKLVFERNGKPNTTNDKVGVVMKLGIYKWDWAQDAESDFSILNKRVIYYDNVNIS